MDAVLDGLVDIYQASTVQDLCGLANRGHNQQPSMPLLDVAAAHEKAAQEASMGYALFTFLQVMWNLGVFLHTIAIVAAIVSYWVGLV